MSKKSRRSAYRRKVRNTITDLLKKPGIRHVTVCGVHTIHADRKPESEGKK